MSRTSIYQFDNFVLDPEARVISYAGNEISAAPKVYKLLLLLVSKQGRAVSKQVIAETVWKGGEVSDAMLSRCVYQARLLLKNHSPSTSFIKTQHGFGFRFAEKVSVRDKHINETKITTGIENGISVGKSTKMNSAGIDDLNRNTSTVRVGILPLPLAVVGNGTSLGLDTMGADIKSRICETPGVELVDLNSINYDGTMECALKIIGEHRLNFFLYGESSVIPHWNFTNLQILLVYQNSGRPLTVPIGTYELSFMKRVRRPSLQKQYRKKMIMQIVDRVRAALGKGTPGMHGGTINQKAYFLFLEAHHRLSEQKSRDGEVAHALLEEALQIDPTFADAWTELGWARYEKVWAGGNARIWGGLAMKAVDEALKIAPDSVFANYTKVIFLAEMGLTESAMQLAQTCAERNPECAEYDFSLSFAYRYLGQAQASARALDASISKDPLMLTELGDPPTTLLFVREWSRFLELTPALDSPYLCYYRGYALWELGEKDRAIHELTRGTLDDPKDIYARLSVVLLNIIHKEPEQANQTLEKLIEQRDLLGPGDSEFTYKESKLAMMAGNEVLALKRLKKAVADGFYCLPYCQNRPTLQAFGGRRFDLVKTCNGYNGIKSPAHMDIGVLKIQCFQGITATTNPPSDFDQVLIRNFCYYGS